MAKLSRTCQKCEQTDDTEFSTCRYCKTRYTDKGKVVAVKKDPRNSSSSSPGMMAVGLVVILLLCAFVVYHFLLHSGRLQQFQQLQQAQQPSPHRGSHHR
jgi:hypothetical protein